MNMWAGAWVSISLGRTSSAAAWGVTPHAQNTGTSPARVGQRRLEGKAASEQKGHQIPPPDIEQIVYLRDEAAILVDAVARQVHSQVGPGRNPGRFGRANRRDLEQRAGPGVEPAEFSE